MTNRITKSDIDSELVKLARTAERLGLKDRAEAWIITRGSVRYREPWRLLSKTGRDAPRVVTFLPDGIIGANATEVMNNIKIMRLAWEHVYTMRG